MESVSTVEFCSAISNSDSMSLAGLGSWEFLGAWVYVTPQELALLPTPIPTPTTISGLKLPVLKSTGTDLRAIAGHAGPLYRQTLLPQVS